MRDEAVLALADAVVALAEQQSRAIDEQRRSNAAMAEAIRVLAASSPAVQHVVIDALPPMNARIKRDRSGRMESITED